MAKRLGYETGGGEDDYVEKCMKCRHSYIRKNESDVLLCSLKECKYEERKQNKRLKKSLAEVKKHERFYWKQKRYKEFHGKCEQADL